MDRNFLLVSQKAQCINGTKCYTFIMFGLIMSITQVWFLIYRQ